MRGFLVGLIVVVSPALALAQGAEPEPAPEAPMPADPCDGGEVAPTDGVAPGAGAPAPLEPAPEPEPAPAPPVSDSARFPALQNPADRPPPAGWRLMLSDLTIFRWNPIGLETRARIGLQKRLYASQKAITRNNFAFVGAFPKLNPASAQLSLGGELQPASILNIRAFGEVQQFFGTFGFLQSFSSANANYSDQTLKDLRDDPVREPQAKRLLHASVQPLLQLKVGPVAIRGLFQFDYWKYDLRAGEGLVYEPTYDTLLPKNGWTFAIDTDVLYVGKPGLAIGVRHTIVKPFYGSEHFTDATDEAAYDGANGHQRIGLFAAYTFKDHGPSRYNKPTVLLIASWYLSHRWRTGEPGTLPAMTRGDDFTSRAVPYFLIGYAFESDFLAVN